LRHTGPVTLLTTNNANTMQCKEFFGCLIWCLQVVSFFIRFSMCHESYFVSCISHSNSQWQMRNVFWSYTEIINVENQVQWESDGWCLGYVTNGQRQLGFVAWSSDHIELSRGPVRLFLQNSLTGFSCATCNLLLTHRNLRYIWRANGANRNCRIAKRHTLLYIPRFS
jgi:hypothetical protein